MFEERLGKTKGQSVGKSLRFGKFLAGVCWIFYLFSSIFFFFFLKWISWLGLVWFDLVWIGLVLWLAEDMRWLLLWYCEFWWGGSGMQG